MPVLNGYFNIVEAAAFLGVHPETVKRLCRSGRLRGEKIHNTWLIHIDQLELFKGNYHENRGRPPQVKRPLSAKQLTSGAPHA
ncbi:MAG TPA: helix-turn-helix domain-containing protein [Dehalococcoidia bacterium]|nr:helix-turn-helix domain-containing protein [Dehalococcoidia bacterium]